MCKSYEGFNNITSEVQNIAVALSLLLGGIWAYSTLYL
jgi:hypothetical protein